MLELVKSPTLIKGRYEILDVIGHGGMGIVYRVNDRLTNKTLALKRVTDIHKLTAANTTNPEQANNATKLTLAREFQTLASLRHPNIISVLDYGFDAQQRPFFTMSFLPQAHTFLATGSNLPLGGKLQLIEQFLLALAYLHRRNVFHRDLKPENVLVSDGILRVLDFGLAASPSLEPTTIGGTAIYAAPEVWEQAPYTFGADLYAMGVMVCELISGVHPFGPLDDNFIDRVLDGEPNLAGIPPTLARVLRQLLARNPTERLQAPEDVLAAFAEATHRPLPEETTAIRESYLQTAPLVGRSRELDQLTQALGYAHFGRGSAWLIGGESGVGKSRLLEEVRILALVNGFQVLLGQAVERGGLPFQVLRWPIRQILLGSPISTLDASVIKELIPDIDILLDRVTLEAPELPSEAARQRLSLTIIELFRRLGSPTVVLLEDLQWSTESLQIINMLSELATELPILVLGSYRHDENPDLHFSLPKMTALELKRLTWDETSTLSKSMLSGIGAQDQIVTLLQKETEGNPFFLVEAVRALAEQSGRLDQIEVENLPETIITGGLQDMIRRRLSRIPSGGQRLLRLAAVAGRELDLIVLSASVTTEVLEQWLTDCANTAVLERFDDHWRFTHDKLRETLLADLSATEKATLHSEVAATLEAVYADKPIYAEKIAYHWEQAQLFFRAIPYSLLAAELLINTTADFARAEQLIERALPYARNEQKISLMLLYGKAADRRGAFRVAIHRYTSVLNEIDDNAIQKIEALNSLSEAQWRCSQLPEAERYASQALVLAQKHDLQIGIARSLFNLGIVKGIATHTLEATRYFNQALDIYRTLGNRVWIARVLNSLSIPARHNGNYGEATQFIQEALAIQNEIGDRWGTASAHLNLAIVTSLAGNLPTALPYFKEAKAVFGEIGERLGVAMCQIGLGNAFNNWNEPLNARPYFLHALPALEELDDRRGIAIGHYGLGVAEFLLGSVKQAQTHLELASRLFQQLKLPAWDVETQAELVLVLSQLGDLQGARTVLTQAVHTSIDLAQSTTAFHALKAATYFATMMGRSQSATRWLGVLCRLDSKLPKELALLGRLSGQLESTIGTQHFNFFWEQGQTLDFDTALKEVLSAMAE